MSAAALPARRIHRRMSIRRAATLTWTLAVSEWKLRFYGSVLGYLWSLARPFFLFGVIYLVFTHFAKLGSGVNHYAVYILFAIVMYQYFQEIATGGLYSLVSRESLLRKVKIAPIVIPLSITLTALFNLTMTLVAVLIFALANGVTPHWGWFELPVLIALLTMLGLAAAMLLSTMFVRFRDIAPIWDVVSQALFYASPILYVSTLVPESVQRPYTDMPIAAVLTQMRHAVVDPAAPPVWDAVGGVARLLIPLGFTFALFALSLWYFHREAPRIAERL
jgi:ABC-2 type transport system permease protein